MKRDLANALSQWAARLAPATRDRLSTYDLHALYDRVARFEASPNGELRAALQLWVEQLGPRTQQDLSRYDIDALIVALQQPEQAPIPADDPPDPTSVGSPSVPRLARSRGYTGEACTVCGSVAMVRSGTCATCQDCGATTGCS